MARSIIRDATVPRDDAGLIEKAVTYRENEDPGVHDMDDPPLEDGVRAALSVFSNYASSENKTRILLSIAALYDLPIVREEQTNDDGDEEEDGEAT